MLLVHIIYAQSSTVLDSISQAGDSPAVTAIGLEQRAPECGRLHVGVRTEEPSISKEHVSHHERLNGTREK